MRPRVFPAEDGHILGPDGRVEVGFNEAAGIPRGRRGPSGSGSGTPPVLQ